MKLRLRVSSLSKIVTLSDDAVLSELLKEISLLRLSDGKQIDQNNVTHIKYGYPPKTLPLTELDSKLSDLGLKSGESLLITCESDHKTPAASSTSPAAAIKDVIINSNPEVSYIKIPNSTPTALLIVRPIPDDNSCLFSSISYSYFGSSSLKDPSQAQQLRQIVSAQIKENKQGLYNKAVLDGKEINEYANWICNPKSWGGAIEMNILSEFLGICIWSIDVETNRIYKFNERDGLNVILLCYSGIHYDSISLSYGKNLDYDEDDVTVFNAERNPQEYQLMNKNLLKLIDMLKQMGKFTNTSNFKIKCLECSTIFTGEREASQHASETGHQRFGEVKK